MREILSKVGFFVLGILSLLYIIFSRNFAEMRMQVTFLNFPIFVGEFFLLTCLILSFFVFDFRSIKGWQWCVVFYFVCVILKTIWGYSLWGPLALRHAALFYYPVCILFGFIFYDRSFLSEHIKIFVVFLILALCVTEFFNSYWILALWIIAFILTRSLHYRVIKYFLFAGLLSAIFLFYGVFIKTSRTFVVGNIAAVVFLVITLLSIAKIKVFYKAIIAGAIFLLLAALVFQYSPVNASGTIFDIKSTINWFRMYDAEIKARRPYYVPEDLKDIKLFNPEQTTSINALGGIFSKKTTTNRRRMLEAKTKVLRPHDVPQYNKDMKLFNPEQPSFVTPAAAEKPQVEAHEKTAVPVEKKIIEKIVVTPAAAEKPQVEAHEKTSELSDSDIEHVWVYEPITQTRNADGAYVNTVFRLFIWRDMIVEFSQHWPILGFSFGKPFRSESLEIMNCAYGEWSRDGWIEPHNSYLNILYRAGILGVALIGFLMWQFCRMVNSFITLKSSSGILLCSILVNWLVAANFLPILELPYNAIPFWALWGVTLGYLKEIKK